MIGFGGDPSDLLLGEPESLFGFGIEPNTGQPVKLLDQPVAPYPSHYWVAHGANPDRSIPTQFWCDWALDTFLREQGLRLGGNFVRDNSLCLALRVLLLMDELGPRAPQPREWNEDNHTTYDKEESLDISQV